MRKNLLSSLICLKCKNSSFQLEEIEKDPVEIRRGRLLCKSCNAVYEIDSGIIDFLKDATEDVRREQEAVESEQYLHDDKGNRYGINKSSIERFREQFLLLPEGDGSYFFKRGGCFQSIAEGATRFYDTLERMNLRGGEKILSLGDGFGYASCKFASRGCKVVALDIAKYLFTTDLYIKKAYFDRIFSDMHNMPFKDNMFDMVFCSAVLHHSKNLKGVFSEILRILKPGGRVFVINESARGVLERVNPLFEDLNKRGYSDTAYTMPEWSRAVVSAGFRDVGLEFLSLGDDYIARQKSKGRKKSLFLGLAFFFKRHPGIEKVLLFLMRYPRVLFRPKSWRMICYK